VRKVPDFVIARVVILIYRQSSDQNITTWRGVPRRLAHQ
jgi:hypothetical protein